MSALELKWGLSQQVCNLHVVERETLEGPLVETLLLALVQAVHRLQPLDKLLPHPSSTSHLGGKIKVFWSFYTVSTCLKVSPVPESQRARR